MVTHLELERLQQLYAAAPVVENLPGVLHYRANLRESQVHNTSPVIYLDFVRIHELQICRSRPSHLMRRLSVPSPMILTDDGFLGDNKLELHAFRV
jgi:hypothetical protein